MSPVRTELLRFIEEVNDLEADILAYMSLLNKTIVHFDTPDNKHLNIQQKDGHITINGNTGFSNQKLMYNYKDDIYRNLDLLAAMTLNQLKRDPA